MVYESIVSKAIQSTKEAKMAFCKFLAANDSGETNSHQRGILISVNALSMLFDKERNELQEIEKRRVKIKWQDDLETESIFTYYDSKTELRITGFGRNFPFLNKEDTGALFVFTKQDEEDYSGFFLYTEDDINEFLETFGLSATETNRIIERKLSASAEEFFEINKFIDQIIKNGGNNFPSSSSMSAAARYIEDKVYNHKEYMITNPDEKIISWTEQEYRLFRAIEMFLYFDNTNKGFKNMDDFVELANQVLNRRKSRAGKSLEHHISALFDANRIEYEEQVITEGKKRPDFIFPSGMAYHNKSFPTEKLASLASKTTCKDRWRQVINEADRLRDRNKYLLTLQQGISSTQLDEMEEEKVVLVVPGPYIKSYPKEHRTKIWTVKKFIDYLKEIEK